MGGSGSVENGGVRIAFEVTGDGTPLVLGHSFLCDRSMWQNQVPRLATTHRVINVDFRGHGASGRVSAPCTLYDLVADVEAVLDALGLKRAVWAGLSVGGMVALRAALTSPDRVGGLILLNTDGGPETAWRRLKYSALAAVARVVGIRVTAGQLERQMFGRTFRREHPDVVAQWVYRFQQVDIPSVLRINDALKWRDDLLPRLPRVDIPALVVSGTEDVALPPARSRRLAAALPRARSVQLTACGHLSAIEQPAVVGDAMMEFLGTLD